MRHLRCVYNAGVHPPVKRLVIVDRVHPDRLQLFEHLSNHFAGDPDVRVIFDRRLRVSPPPSAERREDDESSETLSNRGYVIVPTD